MFMTALNWLLTLDPLARVPGGTIQLNSDPKQSNDYENSTINRDFRERVSAVMEDLWHYRRPTTLCVVKIVLRITPYFTKWNGNFKLGHKKAQKELATKRH